MNPPETAVAAFYAATDGRVVAERARELALDEQSGVLGPAPQGDLDQFDEYLTRYAQVELAEDACREAFARGEKPAEKALAAQMVDVYAEYGRFVLGPGPQAAPAYCRLHDLEASYGKPSVVPEAQFRENLARFTGGLLEGLDLSGVIAAGGAVLGCLLPGYSAEEYEPAVRDAFLTDVRAAVAAKTGLPCEALEPELLQHGLNGAYTSDIDLFVCGQTQEEAAQRCATLVAGLCRNNGADIVMRSSQAITVLGKGAHRDVQLVFRLYSCPEEVVMGFDIDCASVYYDFAREKVFVTQRALLALNTRTNVLNQTRRSTTYAHRLTKYARRGFAICVPGFTRQCLVAESIPTCARQFRFQEGQTHLRTAHEDLYLQALVQLETSWDQRRKKEFRAFAAQSELNQLIAEDLDCMALRAQRVREGKENGPLSVVGGSPRGYAQLVETVAILQAKRASEDRLQNLFSRAEANELQGGRRTTRANHARAAALVEDETTENAATLFHREEPKDVLSHQFHFTSDYCTPASFGFHSAESLRYAAENPRHVGGLFIGPFDARYTFKFLAENPGRQGLLTGSFHPEHTMGYYGDLRLFFGPHVFDAAFVPETRQDAKLRLFFFNHFCSVPGYLAEVFGQCREERLKYAKVTALLAEYEACAEEHRKAFTIANLGRMEAACKEAKRLANECITLAARRQAEMEKIQGAHVT